MGSLFVLQGVGLVVAKDDSTTKKGITLSPPIIELNLDPKENVTEKIKLSNPVENSMRLYPVVYDFEAGGELGESQFIIPESNQSSTYALSEWISYTQPWIDLAINQTSNFNFGIQIPANAEAGGHYGAMCFSTSSPDAKSQEGQISQVGTVCSLILVKVSGDIRENAEVEEFSAPFFSTKGPIQFVTRIENLGNVHFKPQGTISISDWRDQNLENLEVNENKGNVLPESIRRLENKWDNQGKWGRFTAKLSVNYGDRKQTLEDEVVFWIIPVYVLVIASLIFVLLIIVIWTLVVIAKNRSRGKKNLKPNMDIRR